MARTMLHETDMAKYFWAEAINTTCYVHNRIYIKPILNKTTYMSYSEEGNQVFTFTSLVVHAIF